MIRSLLFFLFAISFAGHAAAQAGADTILSYAFPTKYTIGGINVVTDQPSNRTLVQAFSGLRVGQQVTIPGDDISQAIQNLWRQGIFGDVQILLDRVEGANAFLTISVKSRPRLSRYSFTGISKGKAKDLKEAIALRTNETLTPQTIANAVERIKKVYADKGFGDVTVSVAQSPDTAFGNNSVKLDINVNPGPRVKIGEIVFVNNTAYDDAKLRRLMKKTKQRAKGYFVRNSKFKPEDYAADKDRILNHYYTNGYKDALILRDSVYTIAPGSLGIKITLDEGRKFFFRDIKWVGNTKFTDADLSAVLNIKRGETYNPDKLESQLFMNPAGLDVTSLYMDDGYLFFNITPVEVSVADDSVDLEIRMYEGPQAVVRNVTVSGNTRTHDHVILRELRTKPGDKFSRSDIIRTQRELIATGFFDQEKLNVIPTPNPADGTVDIEYIVEEKPSDKIEFSGGYGGKTIYGLIGLELNNFSLRNIGKPKLWNGYPTGDGQRLNLRAQSSGFGYQGYNLTFTEPWFGGKKPNSFTFSLFHSNVNYSNLGTDRRDKMQSTGASIGLGKRLRWPDDYFVLQNSLNYTLFRMENYPLVPNFTSGRAHSISLTLTLQRNSTSDPIYPRSGSNFVFSGSLTPPYSLFNTLNYAEAAPADRYKFIEYHKYKFDASLYQGFGRQRKLVLMTGANYGFLGLYSKRTGITPFERFFLGGDGLAQFAIDGREFIRLRGYDSYDAVTPSGSRTVNPGATIYNRYTMELRYPITTSQAATVYGISYIEAGNAWLNFSKYNPFDLKRSAGIGLRVFMPMFGLIGFDYGYGFDTSLVPGENKSQFHFYIGQPLN